MRMASLSSISGTFSIPSKDAPIDPPSTADMVLAKAASILSVLGLLKMMRSVPPIEPEP